MYINLSRLKQDEKVLEATIEALLGRVQDLKNSCQSFLMKLEQQQLSWLVLCSA